MGSLRRGIRGRVRSRKILQIALRRTTETMARPKRQGLCLRMSRNDMRETERTELAGDAIFKIILKERSFFGNVFFDKSSSGTSRKKKKSRAASTDDLADVEMREARPTAAGDRSLTRALGLKIGKIVIDAGHGGHDTGTIGPNGLLEKDLVLDVAKRLGDCLRRDWARRLSTRAAMIRLCRSRPGRQLRIASGRTCLFRFMRTRAAIRMRAAWRLIT